jgi:peroxiredoxin
MSKNVLARSKRRDAAGRRRTVRIAMIATVALAVVIAGVGIIMSIVNGSSRTVAMESVNGAAAQSAAAGGVIDFQPTRELDTGRVEGLPATAVQAEDNPTLLPVGSMAPDFDLAAATGQRVRLSSFRGRTVLLEFFATWCSHCQAEVPHLKSLMASLPEGSYVMLQVNVDSEDAASILAFDHYYGITSLSLLDPGATPGSFYHQGSMGPVTEQYKVGLYPTFYIVDPKGRIAWRADHEQPDALLREKLKDVSGS